MLGIFEGELTRTVVLFSLFAGLASSLVNGVTDLERWDRASKNGAAAVFAALIYSLLLIIRSMLLGMFAGMLIGGMLEGKADIPNPVVIAIAGVGAFLADPVLTWLKKNWDKLAQLIRGRRGTQGSGDIPESVTRKRGG